MRTKFYPVPLLLACCWALAIVDLFSVRRLNETRRELSEKSVALKAYEYSHENLRKKLDDCLAGRRIIDLYDAAK